MPDRVNRELDPPVDGVRQRWLPGSPGRAASPLWSRGWHWAPWRPRCLGCGEPGTGGRDLCEACDASLPRIPIACTTCGLPLRSTVAGAPAFPPVGHRCDACHAAPPPLARVVAPFLYAAPFDRWVPRFKFHHDLAAGRLLSSLMCAACAAAPRPDVLVPVPLHRTRLRKRGYDQALELARPLSRALSIPLRNDLLSRSRATSAQSSLHAAGRRENLSGAFAVPATAMGGPLPAHVALVDDVMTTGATLHAAALTLLEAGIERVDAWTCARTP